MTAPSRAADRLEERIRRVGPIPFTVFMEEALYATDGYYASPRRRIGKSGDFVTGSSMSPLFARSTARLLGRLDGALGESAAMLEVGVGTGKHLEEVSRVSSAAGVARRLVGVDRMSAEASAKRSEHLKTLDGIARGEIDGLVFSYELFDALPVHRFVGTPDRLQELFVARSDEGGFQWQTGEPSDPVLARQFGPLLSDGQIADVAPGWGSLYSELAGKLGRGLVVTCDYGFERERLLDPRIRKNGTLACYRRQTVHRDPFVDIGEQDLTAHVDFTTLREAGEAAGLQTLAFTRQARWLTACGLFDELEGADQQTRLDAMQLLDGSGMGEEIRVLVQGRGIDFDAALDRALL